MADHPDTSLTACPIDEHFGLGQTSLRHSYFDSERSMTEIGAYEAKTHLPKLLERVQQGERFVITRHGRPVAELSPVANRDAASIRAAIGKLRDVRKALARRGVRLKDVLRSDESLRDLAHEGHRI